MDRNETASTPKTPLPQEIDKTPPPTDEPIVDLPEGQSAAESARVGLEDQSGGIGATVASAQDHMAAGSAPTGGDPDAMQEQAKVVGEEAIGGTTPTPDQDNVDDIAASVGINTQAEQPVEVVDEMHERDDHRFELDPDSKGPGASA